MYFYKLYFGMVIYTVVQSCSEAYKMMNTLNTLLCMPLLIHAHCHTAILSCSGVYETMEKLNTLSDTRDDFIHTLYSFAIPALVAAGEGQADIVAKLQVKSHFFTSSRPNYRE